MNYAVSVILPTRCEAENLRVLVPRISAVLAASGLNGEILVVDDDSLDDTVAVCQVLQAAHPVRLFVRKEERGLASAVLHGLRAAIGDVFVVMDADLSHPVDALPQLIATAQQNENDFVIGSRYVPGGTTYEGWSWFRWLNSMVATLLARPLSGARDPLAGYFALRRSTFANAAPLSPIGYKIGLELIVKCGCQRVAEIPIAFHPRLHGTSKLSLREQIAFLQHLNQLYQFKWAQSRFGSRTWRQRPGSRST